MGRRLKLTREVKQRLLTALRAGNYHKDVCAYAGISTTSFYRWMEIGETQAKGAYRDLWEEVKKAEAESIIECVARIRKAGAEGTWQADAWFLERKKPADWGKRVEIHDKENPLPDGDIEELADEMKEILQKAAKRKTEAEGKS